MGVVLLFGLGEVEVERGSFRGVWVGAYARV